MKTLRHCSLLLLFLLIAGWGPVRAQSFTWAQVGRGIVDSSFVRPQANATDAAGNTYVAVRFDERLHLGSLVLTGPRTGAVGLVKYDATGSVVWAKVLTNLQIIQLTANNRTGGVFLTGYASSGATWDGMALPTGTQAFYAKASAAGGLEWSQALPNLVQAAVVADTTGSAYVLGKMPVTGTVGGTSVDGGHAFLLKANGAGTTQWVRVLHGASSVPMNNLLLGPKPGGGCLVGGTVLGPLYLGAGTATLLLTAPQANEFLTTFDATGAQQWSRLVSNVTSTTTFSTNVRAIAADATGNCYVTGSGFGPHQLGSTVLAGGFFLAKYDAAGTLEWVRAAQPSTAMSFPDAGLLLAAGNAGVTVVVRTHALANRPALVLGTLPLRSPYHLVHYTALGQEQWTVADTWPGYRLPVPPYFEPSGLGQDASGHLYMVGVPKYQQLRNRPFVRPVTQLGAQTAVGNGVIVARLATYTNTLRGHVYLDQNANGQLDAAEGVFPHPLTGEVVQSSGTSYSPVGTDGSLQAYAGPGAYTFGLAQVPAHYTVSQPGSGGTYTGTFSGNNQLVNGQQFGLAPVANQADVRVTLTPYSQARPGFTTRYRLTVENVGTTVASGTATVTLDNRMSYVSSTAGGSQTGQTIAWTYPSLAPFARREYDVLFSLPVNVVLGTQLTSTAVAPLAGDVVPANNLASAEQNVTGSFDPNDITVNYSRLTPAQVAGGQPLDYTIRFQNMGTDTAFTVLVQDTLNFQKLNGASLQLVAQSHNCTWSLSGTGVLTVRFVHIHLPHRNVDVIRSQGFVRFRVQPRTTLTVGEIIPNHARIYFDYNPPVRTNTAITTVLLPTAALARHTAPAWETYPNPATDVITVAAELATSGLVRLELLNVLGRPVRQQTLTAPAGPWRQTLDVRGLAAGVYVLRLTPPTGPATSRQVVRE